ncbi:MAG: MerR family transcriptional regulator [Succinivibrio sp.]
MKIGELSKITGIPVTTIRFFEEQNLLPKIERTLSGQRIYDRSCIERLLFIRAAKNNGMKLSCIKRVIDYENERLGDPEDLKRRIKTILYECTLRKKQMEMLEGKLNEVLASIDESKTKDCNTINSVYNAFEDKIKQNR